MASPIRDLDKWILSAVFTVAPKKSQDLVLLLKQKNVEFKYVDDGGFVFQAASTATDGIIEASVPSLELLWCAAYCYWEMYQLIGSVQRRGDRIWTADEQARRAQIEEMYSWALTNVWQETEEKWPLGLPTPQGSSPFGSVIHVATELFLVALGWILHHEVGHIVHGHSMQKHRSKREQELEADQAANTWLFEGSQNLAIRQKLALGVVTALSMLSTRRQPGRDAAADDPHPHPLERLVRALEACRLPDDHAAYAYAISAMQMNMVLTYYTYISLSDVPFRECFEALCLVIRTHQSNEHWDVISTTDLQQYWARQFAPLSDEEIRPLAYSYWEQRGGCPFDSPEEDWYRAEQLLRERKIHPKT